VVVEWGESRIFNRESKGSALSGSRRGPRVMSEKEMLEELGAEE
jgi:hypothetical protein